MDLPAKEACFIIKFYFWTNLCNIVRKKFREQFGDMRCLYNAMIKRVVERFQNEHTVEWQKGSGWPFGACTTGNTGGEGTQSRKNYRTSVCKLPHRTGMSATSVHRKLQKINGYPCRIAVWQQLYSNESFGRLEADLTPRFFIVGLWQGWSLRTLP